MSSHLVDVDSEIVGSSPSVGSTSVLAGLDAIGTTNAGSMPSLALCPAPFADGNTSVTVAATAPVGPVGLADPRPAWRCRWQNLGLSSQQASCPFRLPLAVARLSTPSMLPLLPLGETCQLPLMRQLP